MWVNMKSNFREELFTFHTKKSNCHLHNTRQNVKGLPGYSQFVQNKLLLMKCEHLESESLFVSFPKRASTTASSYRFSFQQPAWLIEIERNCGHKSMEAWGNLSFVEMKAIPHSLSRRVVEMWDWKDSGGMIIKCLSLRSVCSLPGFL